MINGFTKAKVKAQPFLRSTGIATAKSRIETVDLQANRIFMECSTIIELKDAYECFWNDLNPRSSDIVFVQKITLI